MQYNMLKGKIHRAVVKQARYQLCRQYYGVRCRSLQKLPEFSEYELVQIVVWKTATASKLILSQGKPVPA